MPLYLHGGAFVSTWPVGSTEINSSQQNGAAEYLEKKLQRQLFVYDKVIFSSYFLAVP
jgi:hypothetical protein